MTTAAKTTKKETKQSPTKRNAKTKPSAAPSFDNKVEAKIMATLMDFKKAGIESIPRMAVVDFAGYSHPRTKSFHQAMQKLKKDGYVNDAQGRVSMTDLGSKKSPPGKSSVSNQEVHNRLKNLLSPKAVELFDALSSGDPRSADYLLQKLNYTHPRSKGYCESVRVLKDLGLLDQFNDCKSPKTKLLQLSDLAFPFGRGA